MEAVGTDGGEPTAAVEIVDCGLASAADVDLITDENKLLQLSKLLPGDEEGQEEGDDEGQEEGSEAEDRKK